MPICLKCDKDFPNFLIIDGKKRNLSKRKYCVDCSPFGHHNTRPLYDNTHCAACGKSTHSRMFCSHKCKMSMRDKHTYDLQKNAALNVKPN